MANDYRGIALREEWRPIPRYAGRYEASNLGRVRSLWFINSHACRLRATPLVLKASPLSGGYLGVSLATGFAEWRTEAVHVLVLEAFVGRRPSARHEAAHDDGDSLNNALSNLAWKTHDENEADKRRHGTLACGERSGMAKLTEMAVLEIRSRHAAGESGRVLAKEYGITPTQISRVALRQTWGHVGGRASSRAKYSKPDHCKKLTDEQRQAIRDERSGSGTSLEKLAAKYGVSRALVTRICRAKGMRLKETA